MKINSELMKGSTPLLLMKLLSRRDMYGYEMIKTLELLSKDTFHLKQGSLYPILHSLEEDGYVTSYWEETKSDRKKKYYHITAKGKERFDCLIAEWETYSKSIGMILDWENAYE